MDSITSGITLSASNSDTSSSEVTTARAKNNRNNSNNTDASSFDPTAASPPEPLPMVMEGGPAQIFAMARRMLLWDSMDVGTAEGAGGADVSPSTSKKTKATPLPRWHPHAGISDYNPSFRKKAPAMNSLGYANAIRRNSRKRNKPAMWKYALRTYHRMNSTAIDATASSTTTTTSTSTSNMLGNQNKIRPKIPQRIIHHEGALVACAKLGNWEEAFRIFHAVEQQYDDQKKRIKRNKNNVKKSATTDHMVHSLVKACVKASRYQNKKSNSHSDANANSIIQKRREPLDRLVSDVISKLSTKYHLPVLSTHINPIAAAYQKLHLYDEAANVIETYLSNRTKRRYGSSSSSSRNNVKKYNIRSEEMDMVDDDDDDDDDDYEDDDEDDDDDDDEDDEDEYEEDPKERKRFNVLDIGTKDRGSYSLLVKGAAQNGDWKKAVKALEEMTVAGVYPEKRCLNSWKEATERRGTNIYPWHDSER